MGMFDYIKCEYPLPNGAPSQAILESHPFQTKDTPAQYLETYTITADGRLLDPDGNEESFSGELNFYTSNSVMSAYHQYFTADGEDFESFDFTAVFLDGRIQRVTENERTREVALASRDGWPRRDVLTPQEIDERQRRTSESLMGRELWLWWGGQDSCYRVQVVAEDEHQVVVHTSGHGFEILRRGDRDRLFFDSLDDACQVNYAQKNEWDTMTRELAQKLEAKKTSRTGA